MHIISELGWPHLWMMFRLAAVLQSLQVVALFSLVFTKQVMQQENPTGIKWYWSYMPHFLGFPQIDSEQYNKYDEDDKYNSQYDSSDITGPQSSLSFHLCSGRCHCCGRLTNHTRIDRTICLLFHTLKCHSNTNLEDKMKQATGSLHVCIYKCWDCLYNTHKHTSQVISLPDIETIGSQYQT